MTGQAFSSGSWPAQFGDVLFMAPALNTSLTPPYVRAARIIQVAPPENGNEQKK